jgi:hypothetical protein
MATKTNGFPKMNETFFNSMIIQVSVAIWPFFGPFLTNVAIFDSHFLEKKYLAIH